MKIKSSKRLSLTGGHDVWTTNTSQPRTLSSIRTLIFSLENFVTVEPARGIPSDAQIACARTGWLEPARIIGWSIGQRAYHFEPLREGISPRNGGVPERPS